MVGENSDKIRLPIKYQLLCIDKNQLVVWKWRFSLETINYLQSNNYKIELLTEIVGKYFCGPEKFKLGNMR